MINILRTVIYIPLYNLLIFLAWVVPGHSIGWAIILLTILIRLALLPASLKASRAQVKLQLVQPEINKIRKEVKDQQEQGKALMELYKKEGVSPFGSCLPLLIQLPIIFILYRVFLNINKNGLNTGNLYSFTPHIGSVNTFLFGLNLAKPEIWILPILAGISQYILSKMMMPTVPATSVKEGEKNEPDMMAMMNKQMIYLFPLMTWFIARSLPAGVAFYWIATTLFGIAQQYYVNINIRNDKKEVAEIIEDAKEFEQKVIEEAKISEPAKPNKTRDMMSKMMNKRLDKQEKKTGVEITIRPKKQ
jgi:YidC/Oxa1 family membrane protein insertase